MNDFKIPFASRSHNYTKDEIDIVVKTMQNSSTLTQGENQKLFEEKFSKFLGVKNSFVLNSAASALELSAQLCQFKDGDEVIIPAHTYTASAYPFIKRGAKVIWADIDLKTRVISIDAIKSCISSKTKAIVVVHLYGYGADMPEILALAKKKNLIIIEDAAQALGVKIGNKMAGSYGDFGVFSFQSHKNVSTLGEGGMLVVNNEEFTKLIPMLRHNGHCDFNFKKESYWLPAMGNLDLPEINKEKLMPSNYCMGEVQCALGLKLLDRIELINKEKQKRALFFMDSLAAFRELEFHKVETMRHNYHLLVARLLKGQRDEFIFRMANAGVQCIVQYYPLYRYDFYKKLGYHSAKCPNTDIFFDNMVSFPFQQTIKYNDFEWMIETTKKCLLELND